MSNVITNATLDNGRTSIGIAVAPPPLVDEETEATPPDQLSPFSTGAA